MNSRGFAKFVAVVGIASSLACEKTNPTSPGAATVSPTAVSTDARTGVTTAAPQPVSPANGAHINWASQPVVLVITNGLSTAQSGATYTFDVATDTAFASKVYSKEN